MRKKGFFTSVLMLLAMWFQEIYMQKRKQRKLQKIRQVWHIKEQNILQKKEHLQQVLQVCIQQLKTTDLQLLQKK